MSVLLWGIIFLGIALLLHLVIWKICLPRSQMKALILLFGSVLLSGIIFLTSLNLCSAQEQLHICLFSLSFFTAYLVFYSAIEVDSPSLVIVRNIARQGGEGLSKEALNNSLGDDLLIAPRLKDLVAARLVDFNGATYKINRRGKLVIFPHLLYRAFLGLTGKGG